MSIGTLYNAQNVVVGQAAVLFAASGTALPDLATANMDDPFDLTVFQTEGAAPYAWNPCGATDQGWKVAFAKSTQTINIEEQSTPTAVLISSQTVTVEGSLSEDLATTLALAYNGVSAATAAGASSPGYTEVNPSDEVIEYAVAVLTVNSLGFPRWIYAPRFTQLTNVETTFRRSAAKRMYPVSFSAVCQPSEIRVIDFTAKQTA